MYFSVSQSVFTTNSILPTTSKFQMYSFIISNPTPKIDNASSPSLGALLSCRNQKNEFCLSKTSQLEMIGRKGFED